MSSSSGSFSAAAVYTFTLSLALTPASLVVAGTSVKGQGGGTYDGPNPTGSMTYTVYSTSDCTGTVFANAGTVTLSSGSAAASSLVTFPNVGTYSWKLAYTGDSNYAAGTRCVSLTVSKTTPTLSLTVSPSSVTVGSTATGSSTLTGATTAAAGTATYTVYTDSACTSQLSTTNNPSTVTVSNHLVPNSAAITMKQAGTLYWRITYAGDANNNGATSACTALTVNKTSPTVGLSVSATKNPMRAGGTAQGTASLTSETSTAGGTVTYTVYTNSTCTTQMTVTNNPSTVTVTNGSVPASSPIAMNLAGTVYWRATYSGDANNNSASSSCTSLSVSKARPTASLAVAAVNPPMKVGGTATGTVTLTKASGNAGGTVTYTVYTDSNCGTQMTVANNPSTVTVTNRVVPASPAITFAQTGTYYWRAAYSGDANSNSATSGCISLAVAKTSPTVGLTVAAVAAPMVVGGSATGTASLTGTTAGAGGSVTYAVYTDAGCTTQLTATNNPSTVTVTSASVPASAAVAISQVGTVYWKAAYGGDANNNAASSACVALSVAKTSPTIGLIVAPTLSPMLIGGSATGSASLTNATATAGGTVTYTIYTDNDCTTPVSPGQSSTKTVTNGVVPNSGPFVFALPGVYYWQANYAGDASNGSATSACVGLTVSATATSTVSLTVAPNPIVAGNGAAGAATLSGVTATAGGTVTYTVYSNAACTTPVSPAQQSTKSVTNGAVPGSGSFTFNLAGTRYWNAVYSGDASNNGATSPCIELTVHKASPTLSLTLTPNPVAAGHEVTGAATLTGGAASGGTATYAVFTNNGCTAPVSPAQQSSKTVTSDSVPSSDTLTFNQAGTFYWQITYGGDANNNAATSPCISLTVNKATPALTMVQVPNPLNVGDNFTAHMTLDADAVNPTGTVTVSSFGDSGCATPLTGLDPVTVTLANGQIPDPATSVFTFVVDVYRQATYSGDANNAAISTGCQAVVIATDLPFGLTLSPVSPILRGESNAAQASWPAEESPTGSVTYTAFASGDCTGSIVAGPQAKSIAGNAVAASSAATFATAGTYSWRAAYSGDGFYNPVTACVPLTVKATPTLSLTVAPNLMTVGGGATATATLVSPTSTASGTVTYAVYTNSTCTTAVSPAQGSTKTVVDAAVPNSGAITFSQVGTFYWQAVYSGDANNAGATSSCVTQSVVATTVPTLGLTVSPNSVAVEGTASGTATLTGAAGAASGTVTYAVYTDAGCTTLVVPNQQSVKTVTNGTVPASGSLTFSLAGTFYWKAAYSGDANNSAVNSPCVTLTVNKVTPSVGLTVAPNPVAVGAGATGTATLSGASSTAGGTLTYTIYADGTCSTPVSPAQSSTKTVTNGVVPGSGFLTLSAAGTYTWRASYSGDANNNATTSSCIAVTVQRAAVTVGLTTSSSSVMVWDSATGTATLSGATDTAGGTVVYTVYANATCTTAVTPSLQSTKTVANAVVPASSAFTFNNAGSVYWRAVYSGDANNQAGSSPCVQLTVTGGGLSASIASAQLPPVTYSTAPRSNTGVLVLSVTDQRGTAAGWSVTITVSDFAYTGSSPNATDIPASSFSVTSAGTPTVVRGQTIDGGGPYVPASGATGSLNQTRVILVAAPGSGAGDYQQTIDVTLVIPAQSPIGTYTAVIETKTSAAP